MEYLVKGEPRDLGAAQGPSRKSLPLPMVGTILGRRETGWFNPLKTRSCGYWSCVNHAYPVDSEEDDRKGDKLRTSFHRRHRIRYLFPAGPCLAWGPAR